MGSPGILTSSPTVGAVAPRAVVLRSPTTIGSTVVRNLWRQAHGRRRPSVLRAAALRQLRRATPVPAL